MALSFRRRDQPSASQQLKRAGRVVTGMNGLLLLWGAAGLTFDEEKIIAALVVCMASWGLATGVGLLRLRPWARLSMLVFHSLLCICGAVSVVLLIVHASTIPKKSISSVQNLGFAMFATAWFVLVSVTIGVKGLRFYMRSDIRADLGGTR